MNQLSGIFLLSIIFLPFLCNGEESYTSIDEKMIQAFNAVPKQTANAYIAAMRLVEKSNTDSGGKAEKWREKARTVITASCFAAANTALENNDDSTAYLWCLRGIENGSPNGEINHISMRRVYLALKTIRTHLEQNSPELRRAAAENRLAVLDWRTIPHDSKLRPEHMADPAGHEKPLYEIVEDLNQDSENRLFLKVRLKNGRIMKIAFFNHKGWACLPNPGYIPTVFYQTWEECANAVNAEKSSGISINLKTNLDGQAPKLELGTGR